MTTAAWQMAVVELSDSFRSSIAELARELRAGMVTWQPGDGATPPAGPAVLLILAGGAEAAAIDLLTELPGGGASLSASTPTEPRRSRWSRPRMRS